MSHHEFYFYAQRGIYDFCVLPSVSCPDATDILSQIVKFPNAFKSKGLKAKWLLQVCCNYWNRCKMSALVPTLAFVFKKCSQSFGSGVENVVPVFIVSPQGCFKNAFDSNCISICVGRAA